MKTRPYAARDLAVRALRDRAGNVSAHLERLFAERPIATRERSLARELALGALRRRATLDAILGAFLSRPEQPLPSSLREILHVALYQMCFLRSVPDFAAVNEAVEQVGRFGHKRRAGLVNAVLRAVQRGISELLDGLPPVARDVLPVGPEAYRKLDRDVFPDPSADAPGYLAAAFSLPGSLADRWVKRFGLDRAIELGMHAAVRAPLVFRVNKLRTDVAGAVAALKARTLRSTKTDAASCRVAVATFPSCRLFGRD